MKRLGRTADSVNLASFLFFKRNQISLHKMKSGELPTILIVEVLEKRRLLGIRSLDLKMNIFAAAPDSANLRISF